MPSSCPSGSQPRTHYLTDFETADEEGAPSGWRAKRLYTPQGELPGAKGQLAGSHWHYPPSAPGKAPWSGQRNIWADTFPGGQVPETATSSAIEMQREVQLPEGARLGFIHRFDFTAEKTTAAGGEKVDDFGAGTVEFSLDGGGWADSRTFTGSVPGHRSSHFNLSEMAGKRLRLRFLLTTVTPPAGLQAPEAGAFRGWAIDDVHIYTCEKPPAAPGGQDPAEVVQPSQRGGPLEMKVMRRPRALRRGAKAVLRVAVANRSQTTLRRVRVCFRAPRRILTGPRCAVVRRLPAGTAADLEFRVQVASNIPSRRKRVRVAFAARTGGKQLIVASRRFKLLSD